MKINITKDYSLQLHSDRLYLKLVHNCDLIGCVWFLHSTKLYPRGRIDDVHQPPNEVINKLKFIVPNFMNDKTLERWLYKSDL